MATKAENLSDSMTVRQLRALDAAHGRYTGALATMEEILREAGVEKPHQLPPTRLARMAGDILYVAWRDRRIEG